MDGSAYSLISDRPRANGPKVLGPRALLVGLLIAAALMMSFAIGRGTAHPQDARTPRSVVVVPEAQHGPVHHGVVKEG